MKMETINLVFCDVDGTLLNDRKQCPKENIDAIKALRKQGIQFGISTGRPVANVMAAIIGWGLLNEVDYIIGSNGAEVYSYATGKKDLYFNLEAETIKNIEKLYHDLNVSVTVYEGVVLRVNRVTDRLIKQAKLHDLKYQVTDFSKDITHSYPKVLLMMEAEYQATVLTHAYHYSSQKYRVFPSSPNLLECVHPSLSKAFGITKIMEEKGLSKDNVLCFGDTTNDIEMLEEFVGVCMANSTDDAKEVAKYSTANNNEAGVSKFINKYILKKI